MSCLELEMKLKSKRDLNQQLNQDGGGWGESALRGRWSAIGLSDFSDTWTASVWLGCLPMHDTRSPRFRSFENIGVNKS